jgi:hypothetical protein
MPASFVSSARAARRGRGRFAGAALICVCAMSTAGCSKAGSTCLPSRLAVGALGSASSVGAGRALPSLPRGAIVEVVGGPVACDPRRGGRSTYAVHLYAVALSGSARQRIELAQTKAAVARDGSFRADLTIPPAAPPGSAWVSVEGSNMDRCDDRNGSCAGYQQEIAITAP